MRELRSFGSVRDEGREVLVYSEVWSGRAGHRLPEARGAGRGRPTSVEKVMGLIASRQRLPRFLIIRQIYERARKARESLLRNDSNRPQPFLHHLRPLRHGQFRRP